MREPFRGGDFAPGSTARSTPSMRCSSAISRAAGDGHEAYPNELPDAPDLR